MGEATHFGETVEREARAEADQDERARKTAWLHGANLAAVGRTGARLTERDAHMLARWEALDVKAVSHVAAWLRSGDRFLVLCGSVGVGKTVAAARFCIQRRPYVERDYDGTETAYGHEVRAIGLVVPAGQLAQRIEPWSADIEAGVTRLDPRSVERIALDDLGTERAQDPRFASALFELVDQRQDVGRTLITANLTEAQLRERYDARVIDRVLHQGRFVEVRGKSLRGRP